MTDRRAASTDHSVHKIHASIAQLNLLGIFSSHFIHLRDIHTCNSREKKKKNRHMYLVYTENKKEKKKKEKNHVTGNTAKQNVVSTASNKHIDPNPFA